MSEEEKQKGNSPHARGKGTSERGGSTGRGRGRRDSPYGPYGNKQKKLADFNKFQNIARPPTKPEGQEDDKKGFEFIINDFPPLLPDSEGEAKAAEQSETDQRQEQEKTDGEKLIKEDDKSNENPDESKDKGNHMEKTFDPSIPETSAENKAMTESSNRTNDETEHQASTNDPETKTESTNETTDQEHKTDEEQKFDQPNEQHDQNIVEEQSLDNQLQRLLIDAINYEDVLSRSTLSPHAREFVPQFQMSSCAMEANMLPDASVVESLESRHWSEFEEGCRSTIGFCISKLDESVEYFKDLKAVAFPQIRNYYLYCRELRNIIIEEIYSHVVDRGGNPYVAIQLLTTLIDESQEMGYDLRADVLAYIQQEMQYAQDVLRANVGRTVGIDRFLALCAELYVQLSVGPGRLVPIGQSIIDTLDLMLNSRLKETKEKFVFTASLLKLIGFFLDTDDRTILERFLVVLQERLEAERLQNNLEEPIIQMVQDLICRRNSNWGQSIEEMTTIKDNPQPVYLDQQPPVGMTAPQSMLPVFYGPDGQVLDLEEQQFLEEAIGPDPDERAMSPSMDDEMCEAFDEFLEGMDKKPKKK